MKKSIKSSDQISLRSKEDLQKEVEKDLRKFIREEKKLTKETKVLKEEKKVSLNKIIETEAKSLKEDIDKVSLMSDLEKVKWVVDQHDAFSETINYAVQPDFLNGDTEFDRWLIIQYMQQLTNLLSTYNIELSKIMVDYLIKENQAELIVILNCLNYL